MSRTEKEYSDGYDTGWGKGHWENISHNWDQGFAQGQEDRKNHDAEAGYIRDVQNGWNV